MRVLLSLWKHGKWTAIILPLVTACFLSGWFEHLELMTHDVRFLLRGYQITDIDSDVVVVGITSQCIEKIGEPPWPRSVYADVIDYLHEAGAKVICFDVFFTNPSTPAEDTRLVEAARTAGNCIFPVFCPVELQQYEKYRDGPFVPVTQLRENFPALSAAAGSLAHINAPPAKDGKCRAVPLAIEYRGQVYFAFGIEAASRYLEVNLMSPNARDRHGLPRINDILTPNGDFIINYSGEQVAFNLYWFHQVRDRRIRPEFFKDKLVLIGQTAHGQVNADFITTPLREMFGALVQATIIDNILKGHFLKRQGLVSTLVMLALISVLSTAAFALCRRYPAFALATFVASSLAFLGTAFWLFSAHGLILETVPSMALLAGHFVVALGISLRESREEIRLKDGELAKVFETSRISTEDLDTENMPQLMVNLIGSTVGVEALTLAQQTRDDYWAWENPAIKPETPTRLDPAALRDFEQALLPLLSERSEFTRLEDLRDRPGGEVPPPFGVRSFICAPLIVRNEVRGLLHFYNKVPSPVSPTRQFSKEDIRLIGLLAQQTALIIENVHLIHDLEIRNVELQDALGQLRGAQQELVRREQLSAVGRMAAMIVHDMRSPLTAVNGYAELLRLSDEENPEVREYTQIILEQTGRISQLAQEVLDFARGESHLQREPVDVGEFLNDMLTQLRKTIPASRCTFSANIEWNPTFAADRNRLTRVFLNLGRNAAESMPQGGNVRFCCRACDLGVEFVVADNGPGIPPEIQANLFEAFVTSGKRRGTGLGLAIAKKVVEDHGGSIYCDSSPEGTTFRIQLPLEAPAAEPLP